MVEAQRRALRERSGSRASAVAIGGSLGGQQALQWARGYDDAVDHAIVVGTYDHLRAQGIAQNCARARRSGSIPRSRGGWYDEPPVDGLRLARAIATLTYKSEALFEQRFANRPDRAGGDPSRNARRPLRRRRLSRAPGRRVRARASTRTPTRCSRARWICSICAGAERPPGRRGSPSSASRATSSIRRSSCGACADAGPRPAGTPRTAISRATTATTRSSPSRKRCARLLARHATERS